MMDTRAVLLETDGIKLAGQLYLPSATDEAPYPTVCVCHGIPSGKPPDPNDGGYPALAERICREGLAAFIFNFRGTGASGGNLDMLGWTRDLEAAIVRSPLVSFRALIIRAAVSSLFLPLPFLPLAIYLPIILLSLYLYLESLSFQHY